MALPGRRETYERRILDTKGLAQRLDLSYFRRPHWLRTTRRYLNWIFLLVAAAVSVPLVLNLHGGRRAFSSGPVSRAHAIFEKDCRSCHAVSFERVRDQDCAKCHDAPAHHLSMVASNAAAPANAAASGAPRCAECHREHRGTPLLADVDDAMCTRCHADLSKHGAQVSLQKASLSVRGFSPESHPPFSAQSRPDRRPLKMNHAAHMPGTSKTIQGIALPMACTDCHQMAPRGAGFDLIPVNFEMHCSRCHARELEFDVHQLLGPNAIPAPHSKSVEAIRDSVFSAYRKALTADPSLWRKPLGPGSGPLTVASPEAWINAVAGQSLHYLFDRKCVYCHEIESATGTYPVVRKVNQISGQYSSAQSEGAAWFQHAQFNHRAHRIVECHSCHPSARASSKTSDVLIPTMQACLPCHGSSGTTLDRCSQCHSYHDTSREAVGTRRTTEDLLRNFSVPASGVAGRLP